MKKGSNQYQLKPKDHWKKFLWGYYIFVIIFILLGGIHKIHFKPIVIISPIAVAHAEVIPTPTPTPTDEQIIFTAKHGDIINRLYTLETSRGQDPFLKCEKKGLHNWFGFGVLSKPPFCYKTLQDEVVAIDAWFDSHASLPLNKQLCGYENGDFKQTNCSHAERFMNL